MGHSLRKRRGPPRNLRREVVDSYIERRTVTKTRTIRGRPYNDLLTIFKESDKQGSSFWDQPNCQRLKELVKKAIEVLWRFK